MKSRLHANVPRRRACEATAFLAPDGLSSPCWLWRSRGNHRWARGRDFIGESARRDQRQTGDFQGHSVCRAARWQLAMATTPAGTAVEGNSIGGELWPRLHAVADPRRCGAAAHTAERGLPVYQRLGAAPSRIIAPARDGLDLRRRVCERGQFAGAVRRFAFCQPRRGFRELQLPAGPLRFFSLFPRCSKRVARLATTRSWIRSRP